MNNRFTCLEGTLSFEEEIRSQSVDILSFRQGQQITINRDRLLPDLTLTQHLSQQINNAEKVLNNFTFVKMEELNEGEVFAQTVQVIYNFSHSSGKKAWQVTYSSLITEQDILNFIAVYPDETAMKQEMGRLRYCVEKFKLNSKL